MVKRGLSLNSGLAEVSSGEDAFSTYATDDKGGNESGWLSRSFYAPLDGTEVYSSK
jgi:hypothetical protein